ncbi:MAG: protein kinase, partial [Gemmatimonadaceae bacterium]
REDLTGVLADRYAIERAIGRGGMATVYRAHDLRHDSTVAVKVLQPEIAAFLGFARFAREIQVTAQLQHPNILPVLDSGRSGNIEYYVTPFIEGESLATRLTRERQLPLDDAIDLACEVADALACAHDHGLVHRDIKPGNILLAHGHAVVSDFGIARIVGTNGDSRLTESGIALGTVTYMSPEQASGGEVDGRSDIYSLGCVLYEMLAGNPPFTGANPQAVIARHMVERPAALRTVRPSVTERLEAVVRKALAKSPADRFANATKFRAALQHARAGAVAPHEDSVTWWSTRTVRLATMALAAVAVVAAAVAVLVFAVPRYLHPGAADVLDMPATHNLANIAVLYFDDESPAHDLGYLASGLTDDLIHQLSAVSALHVISRNGVLPFRGRAVSLDSIASVLHVGSVVTGAVQKSGDSVRVSVELVDVSTGNHLDSRTTAHRMTDLFALEDDVSQQVATLLRTQLGQQIRVARVDKGTSSAPARELMLRAWQARDEAATIATDSHAGTPQDAIGFLQRADTLLAQAQASDPEWQQPLIDRGWVAWSIARLGPVATEATQLQVARSFADSALRRTPRSADARELHGTVLWQAAEITMGASSMADVAVAERDLRAAVTADSTNARAWGTLSEVLRFKGDVAEANVDARRALAQDAYLEAAPRILEALYASEQLLGDYVSAEQYCDQGRRRFPNDWRFVQCRLTLMGVDSTRAKPREAWALVAKLDSMDAPARAATGRDAYNAVFWRMVAALISARAGDRDSARAVIAWATRKVGNDSSARLDLDYDEASVRLALGQPDVALRLLSEYASARPALRSYIARDPHFASLRNDPRFAARFTALLRAPPK